MKFQACTNAYTCYDVCMRTTINLNDKLYRALKLRAASSDETMSSVVEDALAHQMLEDLDDIEEAQRREHESTYSFDELVAEFKKEGLI